MPTIAEQTFFPDLFINRINMHVLEDKSGKQTRFNPALIKTIVLDPISPDVKLYPFTVLLQGAVVTRNLKCKVYDLTIDGTYYGEVNVPSNHERSTATSAFRFANGPLDFVFDDPQDLTE